METTKYTFRMVLMIILSFFIGGTFLSQSNQLEELGISQEEYNDMLKHKNDPLMITSTRKLTKYKFLGNKNTIIDSNCVVKPWIIPMLPINLIKEKEDSK